MKQIRPPGTEGEIDCPPKARQLRLLAVAKPLTERLGRDFFLGVPRVPGVYFMYDEADTLLYVGQSGDLRGRLNSYRQAHPDRDSRKTMRLVHQVARIEWRSCDSPVAAVLLENELLRNLRPPFNRSNTWPRACLYMGVRAETEPPDRGLVLRASRGRETGFAWFGAFKPACLGAHAALARSLFVALRRPSSVFDLPLGFGCGRVPREVFILTEGGGAEEPFFELLREYLSGRGAQFIDAVEESLQAWGRTSASARRLVEADLETLKRFFRSGPARVRRFLVARQDGTELLSPEELLDFLAVEGPLSRDSREEGTRLGKS